MQRNASVFRSTKHRENKSITQELAAASGVPPAFRKQLELCCILPRSPQVRNCRWLNCGAKSVTD